MDLANFFAALWDGYTRITPQAKIIHQAFLDLGESLVNDHIAVRTFDQYPISIACLEPHLLELGYQRHDAYEFPQKKLRAFAYLHPAENTPRIFLSELLSTAFSEELTQSVMRLCKEIPDGQLDDPLVLNAGRLWTAITWQEYKALLAESEYAAWVAALGLRANHFTISVNALRVHRTVREVAAYVESLGFAINEEGGRIKGGPGELLEQASTLADRVDIRFGGEELHKIPTCYYEFARRYPDPHGKLYQGFVAASADRIFESTRSRE